jgi:hypothetical protein
LRQIRCPLTVRQGFGASPRLATLTCSFCHAHDSTASDGHAAGDRRPVVKEQALGRLLEPDAAIRRYKAPDSLLEFLKTL